MRDEDVVIGEKHRVKTGLPQRCWDDIHLNRKSWEGVTVRVSGKWDDHLVTLPGGNKAVYVTAWKILRKDRPGNWWLPAFALESACMFQ